MPDTEPPPVLDADTEALIAQLVADSFDYFDELDAARNTHRAGSNSLIGMTYLDYENPLTSYERELLEDPLNLDRDQGWTEPDVRTSPSLYGVAAFFLPTLQGS